MNLPAVELAIQSNHYCHAQKDGSHPDSKKQMARRKLYVASAICLVFMIGEIIGKAMGELTVRLTGAETLNPACVFQGLESHQPACRTGGVNSLGELHSGLALCRWIPGTQPGHYDGCRPPAHGFCQHAH